jgi:hypothetical protein
MTLAISFTASRMGFGPPPPVVREALAALPRASRYVTGACTGGDAFLGRWLLATHPGAEHVVVVPANRSQVDPWWLECPGAPVTLIEMPPGTTYRDRNVELVRRGGRLLGFPAWPEDDPRSARSGTWQAIRLARRARVPVRWHCVMPCQPGAVTGGEGGRWT